MQTDKFFEEWQDSGESQRQFPQQGPTFKVTRNTNAGKVINTAVRATVGNGYRRIEVSLGIVGHNAKSFNQLDGNRDQQLGGWGGDYGTKGFLLLPDNGIADIGITEVASDGEVLDIIDNCQVQTADGEIIRWWTQEGTSGRGVIEHLGKVLSSDHILALAINTVIDLEVN